MRLQFWAADTLRFSVTGPEPHRFLNRAAAAGVRLRRVRWQRDGYAATVSGADRRRLERIAREGGWTLAVTARRGPGKHTERLLQTRPGLAAGAVLFLLLVRALGGLVWCIDFGAMDPGLQPAMRRLLADCGIHEGVLLTKPLLQTAQAQALRRSEVFGWVSLNFTGGCLAIESTPSQTQTVREPPPRQGLYASADGEILAVEMRTQRFDPRRGAFAFRERRVDEGHHARRIPLKRLSRDLLLAAAERLDRKGNAVPQGAGGRVIARVQKHYTARQSLTAEASVYTGRSSVQTTLYLPWRSYTDEPEDPLTGITQTDWLPVQLGRLALPASLCRVTTWEQLPDTVQYSEAAAAALALRACRAALLAEFPDAVIEAEQREISAQEGTETAAVTYIFTANIAAPP